MLVMCPKNKCLVGEFYCNICQFRFSYYDDVDGIYCNYINGIIKNEFNYMRTNRRKEETS